MKISESMSQSTAILEIAIQMDSSPCGDVINNYFIAVTQIKHAFLSEICTVYRAP